MSLQLSSEFTLVVPTMNRPVLLKRLLDYWEETFPALTIIVADSSSPENLVTNQALCSQLKKHIGIHRAFPGSLPFIEKVVKAIELVETPYMALCADDDFLLPEPIEEALTLLRTQPDISCVQGLEIFFRPAHTVGFEDRMLLDIHGGDSIDESSSTDRLNAHLRKYRASMYGVRRSQEFLADVRSIVPLQNQYMLMELAFASLDVVRGKLIRLKRIMTMRESHAEVAFRKHSDVTYWENVLLAPKFSEWLEVYLTIVTSRLLEFSDLSEEAARDAVRHSLKEFSRWYFRGLERSGPGDRSALGRLKSAAFKLPILGAPGRKLWLKAAKAYDRQRIQKLHGAALQSPDYVTLIKRLETYFGYQTGRSIVR